MDKYQTLREKDTPTNNVYPNIKAQNIPSSAITASKIASGAVTASKIGNEAVQAQHLSPACVEHNAIALDAVESAQIASNAVTTAKIADDAVTLAKINMKEYDYNWLGTNCPTCADFVDMMRINDLYKTARCFMAIGDFVGEANLSFDFTNKVFIAHVYVQSNSGYKDLSIDNTNYATDFLGAKPVVITIE